MPRGFPASVGKLRGNCSGTGRARGGRGQGGHRRSGARSSRFATLCRHRCASSSPIIAWKFGGSLRIPVEHDPTAPTLAGDRHAGAKVGREVVTGLTNIDKPAIVTLFEDGMVRSEEHTSELQSLMRITYAVFCLKKKT